MIKKRMTDIFMLLFLLALVVIGASFVTRISIVTQAQPEAGKPTLSPEPNATWDLSDPHYAKVLKQWPDAIDHADSQEAKKSLKAKMQGDIIGATQAAESKLHRLQGTKPAPLHSEEIFPTYDPDGIDNNPYIPPDKRKIISFTNSWRKKITMNDGEVSSYIVFAGALKDDETQGVILISPPEKQTTFYTIKSPTKSGKLRIVGEENGVLQLSSERGVTFYFDYTWRKFVPDNHPFVPTLFPTEPYPAPADAANSTPVPANP